MIRKAVPADIPAIAGLGIEALQRGAYDDDLVISREKVTSVARECVTSARNFAWVAERDGVVGGALCALVHESMFFERSTASVVQIYSRIPGEGVKLVRTFSRWARGRPAIKIRAIVLEYNCDPRIEILLGRIGFKRVLPCFVDTR